MKRDVVPTSESIRLDIDPGQKSYSGTATIYIQVVTATSSFRLHARDMKLDRVALSRDKADVPVTTERGEIGLLTVRSAKPLAPGEYTLAIDFTKEFSTRASSFYRVESGGHAYAFTDFEPDDARGAWPCWDEPAFKIPWQITARIPKDHSAFANTLPERETVEGEKRTVVFKKTPPLSSYLVALLVGPFDTIPIPGLSVPGRVVAVKGSAAMGGQAAQVTPAILRALERYFDRKYPYDKLDLIAVPEFTAGAMENAAAITYRETRLLLDPKTMSPGQHQALISTTAHELAHMWFGDLVTMAWWDDLWLNESFASWMGDKITNEVAPEYHVADDQVSEMMRAMVVDSRLTTRAMRAQQSAGDNLSAIFDLLSYQKGQAILAMLERWLGDQTFRTGVRDYIATHADGNATASDLWAALSKAAGRDVGAVAGSFLDQPGVPIVTLEPVDGSRVKLSQRRFVTHGSARPATVWKIPVTLRYAVGERVFTQNVLLDQPSQTVELQGGGTPGWIHPNADELGYYRWSVPTPMLGALAQGASSKLSVRERIGFLGNLRALLIEGQVKSPEYFRMLAAFAGDTDPEVLEAVLEGLNASRNPFVTAKTRPAFAAYVRKTLAPTLDRIGLEPKKGEAAAVTVLRPKLMVALAEEGEDPKLRARAREQVAAYFKKPTAVHPSLQEAVLIMAATGGDSLLFQAYCSAFEKAKTPTDHNRLLNALAHFNDPALARRALEYSLTGPLRPQELTQMPQIMRERPELQELVFQWTMDHFDAIASRIPPSFVSALPRQASGCSLERVSRAREFFSGPQRAPVGTDKELDRLESATQECVALHEREADVVTAAWDQAFAKAPGQGAGSPSGR